MILRIKIAAPASGMFAQQLISSGQFGFAFLFSCVLHAAGLGCLMVYSTLSLPTMEVRAFPKNAVVQRIEIRLPLPADLLPAQSREAVAAPKPRQMVRVARVNRSRLADSVLLVPDLPDLPLRSEPNLPAMVLWGAPAVERKPMLVPAGSTASRELPKILAQPRLDLPDPALNVADLKAAEPPGAHPKLPVLSASTAPVSNDRGEIARLESATPSQAEGDRINLLSLPSARRAIPPGASAVLANQTPQIQESAASGSIDRGEASMVRGSRDAAAPKVPDPVTPEIAAKPAAVITRPRNGNFDIVVMQSSSDSFPEADGLLAGSPVYTVFIRLDGAHEWMLRYCAQDGDSIQINGPVVRLGSGTSIRPPYPFRLVRPELPRIPGALIVHGYINREGKFERLTAVTKLNLNDFDRLVSALAAWEFRPAERDGVSVSIEAVLIVPRGE